MTRTTSGDVYEVRVLENVAYIQNIRDVREISILVRVFTTLHATRPADLESMTSGPSFRIFYPIDAALKGRPLVVFVGKGSSHSEDVEPLRFRCGNTLFDDAKGWRTVRTGELSDDERKWPRYSITSHAFLLKHILDANKIQYSAAQLNAYNDDTIPSNHALFFLSFGKKSDAARAVNKITSSLLCAGFNVIIEKSDAKRWLLRLNGELRFPISEVNGLLDSVAISLGGMYDGFEQPVSSARSNRY